MEKSSPFGKIIGYLLTLAIGFGGGYLVYHKAPTATQSTSNATTRKVFKSMASTGTTESHAIPDSLAKILIAEYGVENSKSPRPLLTKDGYLLRGFFITRGPLDKILRDTTIDGVSFYLGVDSTAHAQHKKEAMYTLIYLGGKFNPGYTQGGKVPQILDGFGLGASGDTSVYDFAGNCPTACGTLLQKADSAYLHHHH